MSTAQEARAAALAAAEQDRRVWVAWTLDEVGESLAFSSMRGAASQATKSPSESESLDRCSDLSSFVLKQLERVFDGAPGFLSAIRFTKTK